MTPQLLIIALSLAAAMPAFAQAQPVEQLDAVAVKLQRDPAVLPYALINRILAQLQQHGQGLVRMDFKLRPGKSGAPLVNPKLAIQHADAYIPIKLDADYVFDLPVLPAEQAADADLATNQAKGSLGIRGRLHLTTPPEQLDMAIVRRIMSTAHTLRSELLPWYLRWLAPQVGGVRICSATPSWQLQWLEQGQLVGVPLSADPKDKDPDAAKGERDRPCTTLTGQEGWPDAARLVAPAGSKLSVRLQQ